MAHPSFGLVSLLDFPPYSLPEALGETYAIPDDPRNILSAAWTTVALLSAATIDAADELRLDLTTPWEVLARDRLSAAEREL